MITFQGSAPEQNQVWVSLDLDSIIVGLTCASDEDLLIPYPDKDQAF